mmetsp:Transcript_3292/g.8822  ORF Transcript_3292/g.8822 Transcript_3292/m.8822 type:complete len:92 (-) Transcript_3292:48-323(-)
MFEEATQRKLLGSEYVDGLLHYQKICCTSSIGRSEQYFLICFIATTIGTSHSFYESTIMSTCTMLLIHLQINIVILPLLHLSTSKRYYIFI